MDTLDLLIEQVSKSNNFSSLIILTIIIVLVVAAITTTVCVFQITSENKIKNDDVPNFIGLEKLITNKGMTLICNPQLPKNYCIVSKDIYDYAKHKLPERKEP